MSKAGSGISQKKVSLICSKSALDGVYPPMILGLQAVRAGASAMISEGYMKMALMADINMFI